MMKRRRPEQALQRAVVEHIRLRKMPGVVFWHTPNGGKRDIRTAVEMKRQGVVAGVGDLSFLHKGIYYELELKAERGRMSIPQMERRDEVNNAEGFATFAVGIEAALAALKTWGLIR